MRYIKRDYRQSFHQGDLVHFQVKYKETDLDIGVPSHLYTPNLVQLAEKLARRYRKELESYICKDPIFATSLVPLQTLAQAPLIAREMSRAGRIAGVGPMAAVAGAFSYFIGQELLTDKDDIIIENGGDIFMRSAVPRKIGIFAGPSTLSNKVALVISPQQSPLGICTSSGTVGPSLSFGRADAAVILAPSPILADAVASAVGNVVQHPADVEKGVQLAATIPGVTGAVVVAGENIAAWGQVELTPL